MKFVPAFFLTLLCCLSLTSFQVHAQGRHDTIVDPTIIGPAGGTFNPLLTQPALALNNHGDLVFRSGETGQAAGLFFYDGNTRQFSVVARSGDSVNGNGTINLFGEARLNHAANVAVYFSISGAIGGGMEDSAIAMWNPDDGMSVIVREGVTPLGGAVAGNVTTTNLQGLFDFGEIGFNLDLIGAAPDFDWAAYRSNQGGFNEVYREDDTANLFESRVKFNATGEYVAVTSDVNNVVALKRNGITVTTASSTAPAPFFFIDGPVIDDGGAVFFTGEVTNASDDHNLYRLVPGGTPVEVGGEGDLAPGESGLELFGSFFGAGLASSNFAMAFANTLDSGDEALFRFDSEGLTRLATEGDSAPDGNGYFAAWAALTETSVSSYAMNECGVVAFENYLDGTLGGSSDDQGIFLTDGMDTVCAVREGGLLDGDPLTIISWNAGRESDHQSSTGFNDKGQVAYRALVGSEWNINIFTPDLHFRSALDGHWDDRLQWTLSLPPAEVHDVFIDPVTPVIVMGPVNNDATVNSLEIGGNGGTLAMQPSATLETVQGTNILPDGTLTGQGILMGDTVSSGIIAPGSSAGALGFGNLTLTDSSTLQIELGGTSPSQFDRFVVSGDVELNGDLQVSLLGVFELEAGMTFNVISTGNDLMGTFNGVAEGDVVDSLGGMDLRISYLGGDGNDVILFTNPDPQIILGDINQDGVVNLLDVNPFIALISSGDFQIEADTNGDGVINLLDVEPFVAILAGN